jgi:hypothetical protein
MRTCPNLFGDQYSETNVMHFLFSLIRIKSLYMFYLLILRRHHTAALGMLRAEISRHLKVL